MTEADWYVSIQQESYGPVTLDELQQWLKEGRFQVTDYVFGPGFADWTPAGEIEAFQEFGSTGARPGSPDTVPIDEPLSSVEPVPGKKEDSPRTETPGSNTKENDEPAKKNDGDPPKNRRKSLIIITLILVLIIVGGVAFYLSSKGDSDSADNANPYLNSVDLGKSKASPIK